MTDLPCDVEPTPRPLIIGISGRIGSGKTTAAQYLCEHVGFARRRFAGPLKSMMHCLGLTKEHTDGTLKEMPCDMLGGRTPRFAMQTLGTEWGRVIVTPDIWIRAWRASLPANFPAVADDVRFENELRAVKDLGGVTVRIERPFVEAKASLHTSENVDLLPVDAVIVNDGSIEDLERAIRNFALDNLSGV